MQPGAWCQKISFQDSTVNTTQFRAKSYELEWLFPCVWGLTPVKTVVPDLSKYLTPPSI